MKKIIFAVICFLFIPLNSFAISAQKAVVMDLNSGRVLYDLNSHDERLIASITKIMTCIIAINYSDLNKIVVADEDILKAYGSSIYLSVGEEMRLIDLLYGLMMRSGNDAAVAIANAVAGSTENFVYLMNEYAATIGMKNTKFVNPHGLDENGVGNTSSAYDMALLTKVAMQNETFKKIFGCESYQAKSNLKSYQWVDKNKLYNLYPYTTGGKTGYTDAARRTLVTTASKDNKNLVVVTLNDSADFNDHKNLYETYFEKYDAVKVIDPTDFQIDQDYYKNAKLIVKKEYYALVTKEEIKDLKLDITLYQYKEVYDEMKVGEVRVMLKDTLLHKQSIYIKTQKEETLKKEGFFKRLFNWLFK